MYIYIYVFIYLNLNTHIYIDTHIFFISHTYIYIYVYLLHIHLISSILHPCKKNYKRISFLPSDHLGRFWPTWSGWSKQGNAANRILGPTGDVFDVFFHADSMLVLYIHSLKLPFSHLKIGWLDVGRLVSFWDGQFSGAFAVSFREGIDCSTNGVSGNN